MMNSEGGRIVVTASGVHDPQSPGGAQGETATLGDLAGMMQGRNFEMVDGGPFNADKAYKDSKVSLCDTDSRIYISLPPNDGVFRLHSSAMFYLHESYSGALKAMRKPKRLLPTASTRG
jgi:hypothetical protein